MPDYLNIDMDYDISENLPKELSETFSYLGSQIWNFIQMYNQMTSNNNYTSTLTNYTSLLPSILNLDVTLPELKKKQFLNV